MAAVLWMIFVVLCPPVLSESGDDDGSDDEFELTCWSDLTFTQTKLTCSLCDDSFEGFKSAKLCSTNNECTNASLGPQYITFVNLKSVVTYNLTVNIGDGCIEKEIVLPKLVKISAPHIKLATYLEDADEVFIWLKQSHDFVKLYDFQVIIWRDELPHERLRFKYDYTNITIGSDHVGDDGVYYTQVRAKPTDYFDGNWSEWTSHASFTIKRKHAFINQMPPTASIIITFSVTSLVLIIGLGALRWKTQIKGYITPNIPHPKATLAQMHRAKEGLPFTFSPEIFSDVFIHRVDYVDEKPSAPELQDALDERRYSQSSCSSASVSEMDMKADEQLPREQSHLKIRLLDESDLAKERENDVCQDVTAPQRERKDEAYVTMSSLFKKH